MRTAVAAVKGERAMHGSDDGAVEGRIFGLRALLAATDTGLPPVERWDPPYCGDIGLSIRADGVWQYQGSPIRRPALVKLFSRVLRRDDDGRHYLVTPAERVDVAVADAPFLAVEMERHGGGRGARLIVRTNVDDVVMVGPEHPLRLAIGGDGGLKPYVLVRGRLEALATRALAFELAELALAEADRNGGASGLWSDGAFFPLPAL
jgi:hypothetical protein